ncbi:MAG: T9SS type A sorting domain-containing protein [Prevotellaceae bacterium]|nr:T9SS type A sorting domain-containing protein [Prevotellaceae bacterium]
MKKITLPFAVAFCITSGFSGNVITNGNFEAEPSTFTVVESNLNVLMRVANHQDAATQTAAPVVSPAVTVTEGLWVRKSPNSGYIKGIIRTDLTTPDGSETANSVLNLRHNQNNTATGLTNWYQNVAQQRIAGGVNLEKKYILTFDAKVDDETSPTLTNVCNQVVAVIRDITNGVQTTQTISLAQGTTWSQYTATFNLPAWVEGGGATANGSNVIFGLGISTEYGLNDDATKTKYSSILIDNVKLIAEGDTETGLSNPETSFHCIAQNGAIQITNAPGNAVISVYNAAGSLVSSAPARDGVANIQVQKGLYIVKTENQLKKVLVK